MLGLGQIISFIANEGKFRFKNERSIQNSINTWPGMIQQTYHSGLEMWIREKKILSPTHYIKTKLDIHEKIYIHIIVP